MNSGLLPNSWQSKAAWIAITGLQGTAFAIAGPASPKALLFPSDPLPPYWYPLQVLRILRRTLGWGMHPTTLLAGSHLDLDFLGFTPGVGFTNGFSEPLHAYVSVDLSCGKALMP